MDYAVIDAKPEHIAPIAARCRQADVDELWAVGGVTPAIALEIGLVNSVYARTFLIDKDPAAMGGVVQDGKSGVVWMVATDLVEKHKRAFLVRSVVELEKVQRRFGHLYNWVDVRNRKAVRFLKWIGFEMNDAAAHGVMRRQFYFFQSRKVEMI